jgi:hypothetical protein
VADDLHRPRVLSESLKKLSSWLLLTLIASLKLHRHKAAHSIPSQALPVKAPNSNSLKNHRIRTAAAFSSIELAPANLKLRVAQADKIVGKLKDRVALLDKVKGT